MSESKRYNKQPRCAACKFYFAEDSTCRIRSVPGPFPVRKPVEFCFEFSSAYEKQTKSQKTTAAAAVKLEIDDDAAWQDFVNRLRQSRKANWVQAECKFRQIAMKYSLKRFLDFEYVTSAQMLAVKGIGKVWTYRLFEILGECGIFNNNVVSRTGEIV